MELPTDDAMPCCTLAGLVAGTYEPPSSEESAIVVRQNLGEVEERVSATRQRIPG